MKGRYLLGIPLSFWACAVGMLLIIAGWLLSGVSLYITLTLCAVAFIGAPALWWFLEPASNERDKP